MSEVRETQSSAAEDSAALAPVDDWDAQPDAGVFRRAGSLLMVTALMEVLPGVLGLGLCWMMASVGEDEVASAEALRFQQVMRGMLPVVTMSVSVLVLLPGVTYLVLAPRVWRGWRPAIDMCVLLVLTQMVVLGVLTLYHMAGAITAGEPASFTLVTVLGGTPLVVMGFTLRLLMRAQRVSGQPTESVQSS